MRPHELEQVIFDVDEIRVVVRASLSTDLDDYNYVRKAAGTVSLTDWLDQRIKPLLRGHDVAVVNGNGVSPHGRTQIEKIRSSYVDQP